MYSDHMNNWGWTMMIVWALLWIGLLGLIAWIAVQWARDGPRDSVSEQRSPKAARELLEERLASGEIDIEEYQRRRAAIEDHTPVGTA
jgi:putative membrane protein